MSILLLEPSQRVDVVRCGPSLELEDPLVLAALDGDSTSTAGAAIEGDDGSGRQDVLIDLVDASTSNNGKCNSIKINFN